MPIDKTQLKLVIGSLITGFFLGGLILGKSPETKTLYEAYEVVKEVEVERVVEVEKIVEKTVYLKAEKAKIVEETKPDGTLTITSEYYNLGVDTKLAEKSTSKESLQVQTTDKSSVTHQEETSSFNNSISLQFYGRYDNLLSFNYKTDWMVSYNRYLYSSPFFGTLGIGPKQFSLGVGFSF